MSFNIFGPATKNSIRVGYISTDRGFVDNVTICEANDYAKLNPGTQFVFKTRNFIKYLNINEVNKLTPDDIISAGSSCGGIILDSDCGSPEVYFYGGGGVGAKGNPVFGEDGALLAVDLVSGGFGYQYPPIVEVKDNCGIGAGAVARAVLGEVVETVEYYDQEGDFEEYEICEPTDVGYGVRYGPDGKVLGNWDPTLYANLTKDPIAIEIKEYQDFLQQLQTPWWTTRKKNPLRVTSGSRTTKIKHNVTEPKPGGTWTEFLNTYAISPVPPSNAKGTDFGADLFTFEWEEEFPYDGEYIFRGSADGEIRNLYLDNEKIATLANYNNSPVVVKKTIKSGVHRIRLDLKNGQIKEKVIKTPVVQPPVPTQQPFKIQTSYTGVRDVPNNFNAGTYKITAVFKNLGNPGAIAIEIKNKANGKIVFNSLGNIGAATPKLLPITQLSKSEYDQLKNAAAFSDGFLIKNGVFPENLQSFSTTTIEWNNITLNEDGDYQISVCVDDTVDLTISSINALPNAVTPTPTAPKSQSSTQTDSTQTRKIFNTVDYITKANRQLWRLDPRAGRDAGFINQYGVLPFDPNSTQAQTESFSGVHTIVWDNIDFPVDGNYNIEIMVDDDVILKFIGGGSETSITKIGYSSPGKSTGKSLETRAFKKGSYKLIAELKQINVGPLAKGNPMALAVNIETSVIEDEIISPKSWNENPMGVALTIDAPMPPIPQEPIPQQEGRCPNNPIWTTRFPNAKQKWWPVNYKGDPGFQWSQFMNRYAISPIPPLSKKGTDGGGIVYRNEWEVDIPYDGFYAFKSTVDNAGRILVDDKPVMQANYIPTNLKNTKGGSGVERRSGIEAIDGGVIYNFRENNPKSKKVFLSKGRHKIQIEVENGVTETFEKINKKVFSTKDWLVQPSVQPIVVQEQVDEYELQSETYIGPLRDNVVTGSKYDARIPSNWVTYGAVQLGNMARGGSSTYILGPPSVSFGTNNGFIFWGGGKIDGTVADVGTKGPYTAGEYIQVDDQTRVTLGAFAETSAFSIPTRDGRFSRSIQSYGLHKLKVWKKKGSSQVTKEVGTTVSTAIIKQSPTAAGVLYEGPTPIANYKGDFISPVFQNINAKPNEEIQGKTWIFRWSNVDFPVTGQYTLEAEADDNLIVKIDGIEVGRAKVFEGRRKINFNATSGKKTVELELTNIRIPETGFEQNPVVGFAQITVPVDSPTGISKPWTENPMGISAILIPPPCPKKVKGKGPIVAVIVDEPGNRFPRSRPNNPGDPLPGYPVTLRLKDVIIPPDGPGSTGINYDCSKDRIVITPDFGCDLSYTCDTFGRITGVTVNGGCYGFTTYPEITIESDTGIGAELIPVLEVIRDPIVAPDKLIQVTDLVGLKQTGYIDGRPYYGAVFYKDGISYAGFYETPGDLVQVYATLQESIDAKVTTPPSAIQRQGTDINSNNPRLNLPGTPENLI